MVKHCGLVAAILMVSLTSGCTDSVNVATETKKPSATEMALLQSLEREQARAARDVEMVRRDLREETMTPEGAKQAELSKEKAIPAEMPVEKTEETPVENTEASTETEEKPADQATEESKEEATTEPVKEVPKATEGGASVEIVPEVKKPVAEEPVLDSYDPSAAEMVAAEHNAIRELAMLGAKRCMTCDDVSDLNQCTACGHHHKKAAQCPTEHLNYRCEACYGKEGETVVVYPADAPCGACGTVHKGGPHCPHCDMSENEK